MSFEDLRRHASRRIRAIPLGVRVDLTYYRTTIATIRRAVLAADFPADMPEVSVKQLQRGTFDRAELLRDGGSFAVTVNGRRIAIVEGAP